MRKLRSVMGCAGREPLRGRVEVAEAFVGGQKEGARGRGAEGKTAVLVAVEGQARMKLGRVRFRGVKAITRRSIERFIAYQVEPGAVVVTDGLPVYHHLRAAGCEHQPHVLTAEGEQARQELD